MTEQSPQVKIQPGVRSQNDSATWCSAQESADVELLLKKCGYSEIELKSDVKERKRQSAERGVECGGKKLIWLPKVKVCLVDIKKRIKENTEPGEFSALILAVMLIGKPFRR